MKLTIKGKKYVLALLKVTSTKPTYDFLMRIEKRFCCGPDGIAGHGVVIFPRPDTKAP